MSCDFKIGDIVRHAHYKNWIFVVTAVQVNCVLVRVLAPGNDIPQHLGSERHFVSFNLITRHPNPELLEHLSEAKDNAIKDEILASRDSLRSLEHEIERIKHNISLLSEALDKPNCDLGPDTERNLTLGEL